MPSTTAQETSEQTSIEATGTNTDTDYTLPTSWHFAPTSPPTTPESSGTFAVATSSTGSSAPGIPTYMPRLIQPPGGMPAPPVNATLIQIGLGYGLNFPYVVRESDSASQIFAYLPQGIAYGLGIPNDKVKMNALMPFDTSSSLQYITTLAQAYVPSDLVDQLELDLHQPMSGIYSNPDEMIRTLMNMINPAIPILPGANMDNGDTSSADNPAATGGPSSAQGAPIGGDTGESRPVRGSSVGIGVGAVCGAAAYAAAMVYIARRYKKKRASHQRTSSVPTAGEMSENGRGGMGGFFMAGGRGSSAIGSDSTGSRYSGHSSNGRSVREQGISAPVMSENSLGWN